MPAKRRRKPAEVEAEVSQAVTAPSFPLRKDHYFYLPAVSRNVHSGQIEEDREAIVVIQQRVGAKVTGFYDTDTAAAVSKWRAEHDLPSSGLVDADVWAQLVGE